MLGACLAVLAIAALAHVLVTSIRRRRRDLAVLKTMGLVRRQVSAAVAWQATTLAVVALAVAVPVGLAGGHWSWVLFAGSVGVAARSTVPAGDILVLVPPNPGTGQPDRCRARMGCRATPAGDRAPCRIARRWGRFLGHPSWFFAHGSRKLAFSGRRRSGRAPMW